MVIVYGLLIAFFALMTLVMTALTIQAIIDSVVIVLVLFYLALALFFLFLTIIWTYTLIKDVVPQKIKIEADISLTDSFYNHVGSGCYSYIRVDFNSNPIYYATCYKSDGSSSKYSFNQYGHNGVSQSEALKMLRDLDYRLNGYLKINYTEIGGYDSSITVTPGAMPGGGDGYYISVGDCGTSNVPTCAFLYLGETARQKRLENKKARR